MIIHLWEETLCAAADSMLEVGILQQIFDAINNAGGWTDSLLDGADAGNITQLATVVLTSGRRAPLGDARGVAKRQTPLHNAAREVS